MNADLDTPLDESEIEALDRVLVGRFFGIETDGDRLVYVVDMSDSMLNGNGAPQDRETPATKRR